MDTEISSGEILMIMLPGFYERKESAWVVYQKERHRNAHFIILRFRAK